MKNLFIIILALIISSIFCFAWGIKWSKVFDSDDSLYFVGIDNPDSSYCMVVANLRGAYKVILKSTDAGETWKYVYFDSTKPINGKWARRAQDISYPTRNFCIIGLDTNSFLKTTDGGETWNDFRINIPYSPMGFYDVDMYDENNGILTSSSFTVISHDGFETYELIPNPGGFVAYCAELATPNSICIVSRDIDSTSDWNERFYRSDDGGKTWDEYPHPDYRIPKQLQFVDSLIGYEVGGKSTGLGNRKFILVFKTTDGGRSWLSVLDTETKVSFGLQKLDFYDKDNGIVVGQFGTVFWTHDGGKSWIFDSSGDIWNYEPATMNVCYIRRDRAIIADFYGRIFISEDTTTYGIEELSNEINFALFPNPVSERLKIRFKDDLINTTEIKIFNSLGQEKINKSTSDFQHTTNDFRLMEIDVSNFENGIYFIVLWVKGKLQTKSFVVLN